MPLEKPVIGISWGGDPVDYTDIQDIIREAGGVVTIVPRSPVMSRQSPR